MVRRAVVLESLTAATKNRGEPFEGGEGDQREEGPDLADLVGRLVRRYKGKLRVEWSTDGGRGASAGFAWWLEMGISCGLTDS